MSGSVDGDIRRSWWRRLLPGVDSLSRYERAWLRGDVLAGITVAAYLVPQVLAYAGLARVPPAAGLWAAFVALAVYFLLGSSPQQTQVPSVVGMTQQKAQLTIEDAGLSVGNVGYKLHHLLKSLGESLRRMGIESANG